MLLLLLLLLLLAVDDARRRGGPLLGRWDEERLGRRSRSRHAETPQ